MATQILQNIVSSSIDNGYQQDILLRSLIFVKENQQKDFFSTPKTNFVSNSSVKKNFYLQIDISKFQLLQKHLDLELCFKVFIFRGDTYMTSTLKGGGGVEDKTKMRCYLMQDVGWTASILDVRSLFFLLKKIGFAS